MKKLSINQYAKILYDITVGQKPEEMSKGISAFIEFVQKNRAWKKMNEIGEAFQKYSKKQEGWVELHITSAQKLSQEIIEEVKKNFGTKVEVTTSEEKSLIGGIKVQTDNKIFDASVKTQLQKMKETL